MLLHRIILYSILTIFNNNGYVLSVILTIIYTKDNLIGYTINIFNTFASAII
jgi:hypothetical protein